MAAMIGVNVALTLIWKNVTGRNGRPMVSEGNTAAMLNQNSNCTYTGVPRKNQVKVHAGLDSNRLGETLIMAITTPRMMPMAMAATVMDLLGAVDPKAVLFLGKCGGLKKTKLGEYDSNRSRGLIAINLRDNDEVIGAELVSSDDDVLLVSRKGMSVRFTADDKQLRPMGRATSGVTGMKFRSGDSLLSMSVVRDDAFVFTVTDGGFAKRTPVEQYRVQNRSGLGIKAMKLVDERGALVGALVVDSDDEVLAVTASGGVIRSRVGEVNPTGRDTMGVKYMNLADGDRVLGIARNADADGEDDDAQQVADGEQADTTTGVDASEVSPQG